MRPTLLRYSRIDLKYREEGGERNLENEENRGVVHPLVFVQMIIRRNLSDRQRNQDNPAGQLNYIFKVRLVPLEESLFEKKNKEGKEKGKKKEWKIPMGTWSKLAPLMMRFFLLRLSREDLECEFSRKLLKPVHPRREYFEISLGNEEKREREKEGERKERNIGGGVD